MLVFKLFDLAEKSKLEIEFINIGKGLVTVIMSNPDDEYMGGAVDVEISDLESIVKTLRKQDF